MKDSDMVTALLGPIVDELGMTRATQALDVAKPVMEALTALVNTKSPDATKQLAIMDTFRLVELWCKAIRELSDKVDSEEFPDHIEG